MQLSELSERGRAWWCRTWVIQEMILPARLFVCIGSQVMGWDQFVSASSSWESYDYQKEFVLRHSHNRLEAMNQFRKRWQRAKYCFEISELLELGRYSSATDAKDNVYGILGLVNPQEHIPIGVDYNLEPSQVYAEITAIVMKRYKSLDPIVSSFWHKTETSQDWLPSWVIDYGTGSHWYTGPSSGPLTLHSAPKPKHHGYTAGAGTTASISLDKNILKLHLEAVVLDSFVETLASDDAVGEKYRQMPTDIDSGSKSTLESSDHEPIPAWLQSWLVSAVRLIRSSLGRETPASNPRQELRQLDDVVSILMYSDHSSSHDRPFWQRGFLHTFNFMMLAETLQSVGSLNDHVVQERLRDRHGQFEEFLSELKRRTQEVLFGTEYGFVGWAQYDLRQSTPDDGPATEDSVLKGDIIVVPRGASMPWVLRATNVTGEYRFITECVVHDIMKGELMSLVESRKLQTERFTLV